MALYLGDSEKLKINLDGAAYCFIMYSESLATNVVRLLSSDNYVLTDCNELYLTARADNYS